MNNKVIGTEFEQKVVDTYAKRGYWVHFIVPDSRGAQPFDIIAVKDGNAFAMDCKTCKANVFNINRLEDNQIMAFEKWLRCGNTMPLVIVEHGSKIYIVRYDKLKEKRSINLEKEAQVLWIE